MNAIIVMAQHKYRIDNYGNTVQIEQILPNPDDWDKYRYEYYTSFRPDLETKLYKCNYRSRGMHLYHDTGLGGDELNFHVCIPTEGNPDRTLLICEGILPTVFDKDYPSYWNF